MTSFSLAPNSKVRLLRSALSVLLLVLATLVVCRPTHAQTAPSAPNAAQVHDSLNKILSEREFQPEVEEDGVLVRAAHWMSDQWAAFRGWLSRLFRPRTQSSGDYGFVANIIVYLMAGGLIVLMAWGLAVLIRSGVFNRKKKTKRPVLEEMDDPEQAEIVREPDVWLQTAQSYAQSGDYRRAYRAVFLAILLLLDRADIVEYVRSRTNGEYPRLLWHDDWPTLREAVTPVVTAFDRRWYGTQTTTETDYQDIVAEYQRFPERIMQAQTQHSLREQSLTAALEGSR